MLTNAKISHLSAARIPSRTAIDAKAVELRSQSHTKLPVDDPKLSVPTPVASYVERLKQEQEAKKLEALGTTSFARLKTHLNGGEGSC